MSNLLQVFSSEEFGDIRSVFINGQVYFVGTDVTKALGYIDGRKAVRRHCKNFILHRMPNSQGSSVKFLMINIGDVYRLAIKSSLPGADKFEAWIFDEVVPQVSKTGYYSLKDRKRSEIAYENYLLELEQERQEEIIREQSILIDDSEEWLSIWEANNRLGLGLNDNEDIRKLAVKMTAFCRANDIEVRKIYARPGSPRVNSYPLSALLKYFMVDGEYEDLDDRESLD